MLEVIGTNDGQIVVIQDKASIIIDVDAAQRLVEQLIYCIITVKSAQAHRRGFDEGKKYEQGMREAASELNRSRLQRAKEHYEKH